VGPGPEEVGAIRAKIREEAMKLILKEAAVKIAKYLRLMGKEFRVIKDMGVAVEENLGEVGKTTIVVSFRPPEWVEIKTMLMSSKEVDREVLHECGVFEILMRLSHDFAELSFCMDHEGNIYAKQNILVGALSFDVFREEYDAVYLSALIFRREILPKIKKCVRDYQEFKDAYSGIM